MCRAIKTLHNVAPPASDEEIRASSLQFVRKLSGFTRPSRANDAAFARAVDEVAAAARTLLDSLVTSAAPRDRAVEAARAAARGARRPRPAAAMATGRRPAAPGRTARP
ncbi:MAG TPA: DUF2277 domain-containing protein [Methylomirabilota bacterium]